MSILLIAVTLSATPVQTGSFTSYHSASNIIAEELQTGTLIFSKGDCLAVKIFTQSPYTHVAAVVRKNGQPFVYDSTSGKGVRCQSLKKYLKSQNPDLLHLMHPRKPFSKQRSSQFQEHLDEELGRPYAIKHHLTGNRAGGVHCSEYITDALISCHLIHANQPSRVSPASLAEGILQAGLYNPARTIEIKLPDPQPPTGSSWCERIWFDTKLCTIGCCKQLQRWFLCR